MWGYLMIILCCRMTSNHFIVQLKLLKVLKRSTVWLEVDCSCCVSDTLPPSSSSLRPQLFCRGPMRLSPADTSIWVCPHPKRGSDIISPPTGQLMGYLPLPQPPNPVSSCRSHLQCKTISAHVKRQLLPSGDHKLLLENGIILTRGYSLSSQGPEGDPSLFNNMYV